MNILEKDIENLVYESLIDNPSLLFNKGLDCVMMYDIFTRQLDLGSYGIADIVCFKYNATRQYIGEKKTLNVCIMELKKNKINPDTYMQALRYAKGIEEYVDKNFNMNCDFRFCLIGTSISVSDNFVYYPDYIDNLDLFTVKLDLEHGISFKRHSGYHLSNARGPYSPNQLISKVKGHVFSQIRKYVSSDKFPF